MRHWHKTASPWLLSKHIGGIAVMFQTDSFFASSTAWTGHSRPEGIKISPLESGSGKPSKPSMQNDFPIGPSPGVLDSSLSHHAS